MATPRFSVVVPAYNGAATIAATLRSIQAQSVSDFELIVVDDESSDDTLQVVERIAADDDRVRVTSQENQGVAGARNTGVSLAQAPYVAFLDNDDLWMPGYLASMGRALDGAPQAGFAYTDAYLLDDKLSRIHRLRSLEFGDPIPVGLPAEDLLLRLVDRNFVMSSVTVRRDAIEAVGGFSTLVNGVDDWDLWLRMIVAGWDAVQADDCVLIQRDRADSQSKDELMMLARSEVVLLRLLDSELYPPGVCEAARVRLADVQRRLRRETSYGPYMGAIRLRRKALRTRDRLLPEGNWLADAPGEVAGAFPEIAAAYGRGSTSVS